MITRTFGSRFTRPIKRTLLAAALKSIEPKPLYALCPPAALLRCPIRITAHPVRSATSARRRKWGAPRLPCSCRLYRHIRLYGVKDTGISKGAFSSYLSGQYNPKADKTELIADSLDVDLRWLYGENVPMENTQKDDPALQYVFYNNSCSEYLLDDLDDMYIAMKTQYSASFHVFMFLSTEAEMKYT